MKSRKWTLLLVFFLAMAATAQQTAPAQPVKLVVRPINGTALTLGAQELAKLPQVKVSAKDHDENNHEYGGAKLHDLLVQAGAPTGHDLRGKEMADYVVVEASDGYRVVFSLAELDPDLGNTQVVVAQSADGQPLGAKEGPLRLVVPGDNRPARWVRMVRSVSVMRAQ